jgi:hypothetical protein
VPKPEKEKYKTVSITNIDAKILNTIIQHVKVICIVTMINLGFKLSLTFENLSI